MKPKRIALSNDALRDVGDAVEYYAREASPEIARAFVQALESTYDKIADAPAHTNECLIQRR